MIAETRADCESSTTRCCSPFDATLNAPLSSQGRPRRWALRAQSREFLLAQRHRFELTEPIIATDHVIGPWHAPVTIVEYGDFECPNCKQAAPAVKLLLKSFANHVRFVYRHFPLEAVHPHALKAAEAAECAGDQGKFWEMHDLLFDHQAHLEIRHLHRYAESLELEMTRFNAEMSSQIFLQRIREQIQSGNDSGARGTPTFFVNGRIEDVSFGLSSLFDAVKKALSR